MPVCQYFLILYSYCSLKKDFLTKFLSSQTIKKKNSLSKLITVWSRSQLDQNSGSGSKFNVFGSTTLASDISQHFETEEVCIYLSICWSQEGESFTVGSQLYSWRMVQHEQAAGHLTGEERRIGGCGIEQADSLERAAANRTDLSPLRTLRRRNRVLKGTVSCRPPVDDY